MPDRFFASAAGLTLTGVLTLGLLAAGVGCGGSVDPGGTTSVAANPNGSGGATNANGTLNDDANATAVTPSTDANATTTAGASDTLSSNAVREAGPVATVGQGLAVAATTGCATTDYIARFRVGGQSLGLIIDSGSSTLAVASSSCTDCAPATSYSSTTGTKIGKTVQSVYGQGEWQGTTYRDTVTVGDATPSKSVSLQFVAITDQNSFFSQESCDGITPLAFDGIAGMGPDALLVTGTTSLLTVLQNANGMAHNAFAIHSCGSGGNFYLGGYPAAAADRQPAFFPLLQSGATASYYSIQATGVGIGNTNVSTGAIQMIVDNGTSGLYLPDAIYQRVMAQIASDANFRANFNASLLDGSGSLQVSAQGLSREQLDAALPRLRFVLPQAGGGLVTLSLPATDAYLFPLQYRGQVAYTAALASGETLFGAQSNVALFGNIAMHKHLVIFDRAGGRIGFAEHDGCNATIPTYVD